MALHWKKAKVRAEVSEVLSGDSPLPTPWVMATVFRTFKPEPMNGKSTKEVLQMVEVSKRNYSERLNDGQARF